MSVKPLSVRQTNLYEINDRVNQLMQGRSNAVGFVTLSSTGATSTTVSAVTCGSSSHIFLSPKTSNSGNMKWYVPSTDISKAQFIVHHSSTTSTDLLFGWEVRG